MTDFRDTILELIEDLEAQGPEITLSELSQNVTNVIETAHILVEGGLHSRTSPEYTPKIAASILASDSAVKLSFQQR